MKEYTCITGASSGLGQDFAREYAKQKQNLILVARRFELLEELRHELSKYNIDILIYKVDLSDKEQLDDFIHNLPQDIFISRLINNAGFGNHSAYENQSEDTLVSMIRVNIEALSLLAYHFIPQMKVFKKGEILNVASVAAFSSGPYMAEYYASKAYVLSLSNALRDELSDYNIKVSALCPGPTHTNFFKVAKNGPSLLFEKFTMESLPVVQKSMRDLHANKAISVPGLRNQFLVLLTKITPRTFASHIVKKIQETRS